MRILAIVACGAMLSIPPHSRAEVDPAPPRLAWECGYDPERAAMACHLVDAPLEAVEAEPRGLEGYPPLLRTIRLTPSRLVGEMVFVPLYAPPIDMKLAVRLARAVLCAGKAGCTVDYAGVLMGSVGAKQAGN